MSSLTWRGQLSISRAASLFGNSRRLASSLWCQALHSFLKWHQSESRHRVFFNCSRTIVTVRKQHQRD
jgi:hypothetical protein